MKKFYYIVSIGLCILLASSCEDFISANSNDILFEEDAYNDFEEIRASMLGLYSLQQNLVEQLIVLGELRADLLTTTENIDANLTEIENFSVSANNPYTSPRNFYHLILNCNKLINEIVAFKPDVKESGIENVNNYDRFYGEAVCMRAWAYFHLARIYNNVPVYFNELKLDQPLGTQNVWDHQVLIDTLISQLESLKIVGYNYNTGNDNVWNVSVWNNSSKSFLMGQIYLHNNMYAKAEASFVSFFPNNDIYSYNKAFNDSNWVNIFNEVNAKEQVFSIVFDKENKQQHQLQNLFYYDYLLKPSQPVLDRFNSQWDKDVVFINKNTGEVTYSIEDVEERIEMQRGKDPRMNLSIIQQGQDKYMVKKMVDLDAGKYTSEHPYVLYRNFSAYLYLAEIISLPRTVYGGENSNGAYAILENLRTKRMGLEFKYIKPVNINGKYNFFNPLTHEIDSTRAITDEEIMLIRNNLVIDERALELAFEGERFYDLMRIAKRRNDPAYLADKVAAKFPVSRQSEIRTLLMDSKNWYLPFPEMDVDME